MSRAPVLLQAGVWTVLLSGFWPVTCLVVTWRNRDGFSLTQTWPRGFQAAGLERLQSAHRVFTSLPLLTGQTRASREAVLSRGSRLSAGPLPAAGSWRPRGSRVIAALDAAGDLVQ